MGQNLKARLQRIRDTGGSVPRSDKSYEATGFSESAWPGWTEAGFKTLKRKLCRTLPFHVSQAFPEALAIVIPDLLRLGRIPSPGELLFFDLETTGLSGGAGTLAFLAAFGRFMSETKNSNASARIEITQYLLLDYPGEPDFIEMAVKEFSSSALPVVVSYNGKCFDSQILRNRCLMNGIMVPAYAHADLLHPARRLWKRILSDCSQSTVEVSALGLDRTGDISGAEAPDIWFSFLRSGENSELLSVCDHNARDIAGLASLFLAMEEIANDPFKSLKKFHFDEEDMALLWTKAVSKNPGTFGTDEKKTGELLLETAAKNGLLWPAIVMAIKAEWRLKNPALALSYTKAALANSEINEKLREELEKRRIRLEGKIDRRQH